jgi:flagellar biosynthesis/type III secretory pathway protein FliH
MIDMKQFFELYGKPNMSKTERGNAEQELNDFFSEQVDAARQEGYDDGHTDGYDEGYDEGYESGKDDAENKEAA